MTIALTVLGSSDLMRNVLEWLGLQDVPGIGVLLRVVSLLVSVLISWLLFTWVIARLPRESVSFRSSVRAGLIAAVGFEVFKQLGSIYLQSVVHGPAGATFGPVLGLMVFAYITARLILFATAWAATSAENLAAAPVEPPGPAQITPRVQVDEGLSTRRRCGSAVGRWVPWGFHAWRGVAECSRHSADERPTMQPTMPDQYDFDQRCRPDPSASRSRRQRRADTDPYRVTGSRWQAAHRDREPGHRDDQCHTEYQRWNQSAETVGTAQRRGPNGLENT